jgi:hypothetical protein
MATLTSTAPGHEETSPLAAQHTGKSAIGFRPLFFLGILAVDVALALAFLQDFVKEGWFIVLLKVMPYVMGTLLLAKLDEVRNSFVARAKKLPFDISVSVVCIVLFYAYYWLPSGTIDVPVRLDPRATLVVDGEPRSVRKEVDSAYSGTVRLPIVGVAKNEFSVRVTVRDSLRQADSESLDVYSVGLSERLRAWSLLRRSPLSYVLELPSAYPVSLQFDSARSSAIPVVVEGRFPRRFLDAVAKQPDRQVDRIGPERDAGKEAVYSTDSARVSFSVDGVMAAQTVHLPRGSFAVRIEEVNCTRTIPLNVTPTVIRIPVDTHPCGVER